MSSEVMMQPFLAIDIDDVLLDTAGAACDLLGGSHDQVVLHPSNHGWCQLQGVPSDYWTPAVRRVIASGDIKPVLGAQEATEILSRHFRLVAVTARPKNVEYITLNNLVRYDLFNLTEIIHCESSSAKPKVLKDWFDSCFLIDDFVPSVDIEQRVVLFGRPWNQQTRITHRGHSVPGWGEPHVQELLNVLIRRS